MCGALLYNGADVEEKAPELKGEGKSCPGTRIGRATWGFAGAVNPDLSAPSFHSCGFV